MKQSIITATLFFSIVANIFGLSVIVMQDDIITQYEYDLNVSQTALAIAKSPYFIQHSPHCSDSWLLK